MAQLTKGMYGYEFGELSALPPDEREAVRNKPPFRTFRAGHGQASLGARSKNREKCGLVQQIRREARMGRFVCQGLFMEGNREFAHDEQPT